MSMNDVINELLQKNTSIGALVVIKNDGSVVYSFGQWQVDGAALINSIKNKDPSVTIQGVKYSTLTNTGTTYLATNIQGQGHVVGAAIGDKGWIIAYVGANADRKVASKDVFETASKLVNAI